MMVHDASLWVVPERGTITIHDCRWHVSSPMPRPHTSL
jgi:hypothetical protein